MALTSHLGRPDGKVEPSMSLRPVYEELKKLFPGGSVDFAEDFKQALASSARIVLLENLRFHLEEEGSVKQKDGSKQSATPEQISSFRKALSSLGDIYVNDAFGTLHRAHSSIVGVDMHPRVAGLLVAKELEYFARILGKHLDVLVLGGAKVSDKLQLMMCLLPRVKHLVIGGAMAFTFLKQCNGVQIGKSLLDPNAAAVAQIMAEAERLGVHVHLPVDYVVADRIDDKAEHRVVEGDIPDELMGLDIGPKTASDFSRTISAAKTVFWNGPMGVFELEPFSKGTFAVLQAMASVAANGGTAVVGTNRHQVNMHRWRRLGSSCGALEYD